MSGSKDEVPVLGKAALPFHSDKSDLDVTIEIVETDSLEKRLDEFSSIAGEAVFRYTSIAESVLKDMEHEDFFIEYWRYKRTMEALSCLRRDQARLEELEREQNEIQTKKVRLIQEAREFLEACNPEEKKVVGEIWQELKDVD